MCIKAFVRKGHVTRPLTTPGCFPFMRLKILLLFIWSVFAVVHLVDCFCKLFLKKFTEPSRRDDLESLGYT